MKALVAVLTVLALVAAFALGRLTAPRKDDRAPFRAALATADPVTRAYRLSAFLEGLGPDGVAEVVEALDASAVVGVSADELDLLMLAWTRFDAPAAFEWAISVRERAGWPMLAPKAAIYAWGFRDPGAALPALEAFDAERGERLKRTLREALVSGWIHSGDIEGVTAYLAAFPRGDRRQVWTNWLTKELLEDGVEAVHGWADAVPEDAPGSYKSVAFRIAANAAAMADPIRTAAWYEANAESDYAGGALRYIARRWVDHYDAQAAIEWLILLPPSRERDAAIGTGFANWLGKAPEDAQAWLREAPRTAALDPALQRAAAMHLGQGRGAHLAALEWALRIQDDEERRELLARAARRWGRNRPEPVEAWAAGADLSDEDREVVLKAARAHAERPEASGQAGEVAQRPRRSQLGLGGRIRANQRAGRVGGAVEPSSPLTE